MSNSVLSCSGVSKAYAEAGQELEVLKGIELTVNAGERIAIIGSSGSGKSTLLNILGGLEAPTTGDVSVVDKSLYQVSEALRSDIRNCHLGFVYQFHHLLPEFTALENTAIPLLLGKESVASASSRAKTMLAAVGLSERVQHKPGQLSGGERQRVAIARALINQPSCVLMDEPTGNLDQHTAGDIQALMDQLNRDLKTSFIVVTHDIELAHKMDRVLELREGRLVSIG